MRAYTIAFFENVKYVIVQSEISYNAILGKFAETLQKNWQANVLTHSSRRIYMYVRYKRDDRSF